MSTFDGKVAKFPDIRIDYFRRDPDPKSRPPLAYFLSHVHSDHLVGLDTCKSPFVYCTAATRDILLRLEKYPHRMNFARGILESRIQTYKHLKKLLIPMPLETSTKIELVPGREIQVTLFDANHCVGACMFLIEGDGKAILYTGDIRSEAWWVNSLIRNPILLPYTCPANENPMKRLDCIYMDTTFVVTGKEDPYCDFPSKAQGINELLRKVAQYPSGTQFYFDSWTFGYEDVWEALSRFLGAQVHLDEYRYKLYLELSKTKSKQSVNGKNEEIELKAVEAQKMIGYRCGNHNQPGYLTNQQSRLHSCEKGTGCSIWDEDFVRITPIVSRYQGVEMVELGAGGGQHDLNQQHELEFWNKEEIGNLVTLCTTKLQGQPQLLSGVVQLLAEVISNDFGPIKLQDFVNAAETRTSADGESGFLDLDGLPLERLIPALAKIVTDGSLKKQKSKQASGEQLLNSRLRADGLPKHITFPYSRHSSYNELRCLVQAFKPREIFPCTVDEKAWKAHYSMGLLFGDIYASPPTFRHDRLMREKHKLEDQVTTSTPRPSSAQNSSSAYATPNEDFQRDHRKGRAGIMDNKRSLDDTCETQPESKKLRSMDSELQRTRIYVGNLGEAPEDRIVEKLNRIFKGYIIGIASIPVDSGTRETLGYAFVDMHSPSEAQRAIDEKHGSVVATRTLTVELAGPNGSRNGKRARRRDAGPAPETAHDGDSLECGSTAPSTNFLASTLVQKDHFERQRPQHQSIDYGRLSPPPTAEKISQALDHTRPSITEVQNPGSERLRRSALGTRSSSVSTAANQRLAFRQEAYNAVLGVGGSDWSNIGLVSVSGHQAKEEEL